MLLDSGRPVTVLRPSKVHGAGAPRPREWFFVKRVLDRRPAVLLARRGAGVDHTTAAANIAALIEAAAARAGPRILNSADPDAPSALEISRAIARRLGHDWEEVLLDDGRGDARRPSLGRAAPDRARHERGRSSSATCRPATTRRRSPRRSTGSSPPRAARRRLPLDEEFFAPLFDYAAEDRYLAAAATRRS